MKRDTRSDRKRKSNKEYRRRCDKRENFPNGYIETWHKPVNIPVTKQKEADVQCTFTPVSVSLIIENNIVLNKDNGYVIRFNSGIQEGTGVNIDEHGKTITFSKAGSYQFDLYGDVTPFSDVEIDLVYYSDILTADIIPFSTTRVPKSDGKVQLRGIPIILPVQKNQTITVKLIPNPDESIIVQEGTRLLIHRVA